jgi:hypothetical protein
LNTSKLDGHVLGKTADGQHEAEPVDPTEQSDQNFDTAVATVATVAVVGVGVIAFEAALLPGLALGVVTMLVPKFLPKMSEAPIGLARRPRKCLPRQRSTYTTSLPR